jgi:hypothetical protein
MSQRSPKNKGTLIGTANLKNTEEGGVEAGTAVSNEKCDADDEEAGRGLQPAEEATSLQPGFIEESVKPLKQLFTATLPPHYYEFSCHVLAFVTSISVAAFVLRQHGFSLFAW